VLDGALHFGNSLAECYVVKFGRQTLPVALAGSSGRV
jgi:hypothetical protein